MSSLPEPPLYGRVAWPATPRDIRTVAPPPMSTSTLTRATTSSAGSSTSRRSPSESKTAQAGRASTARMVLAAVSTAAGLGLLILGLALLLRPREASTEAQQGSKDASAASAAMHKEQPSPVTPPSTHSTAAGAPFQWPQPDAEGVTHLPDGNDVLRLLQAPVNAATPFILFIGAPWCHACQSSKPYFVEAARTMMARQLQPGEAHPVRFVLHMAPGLPQELIQRYGIDKTGIPHIRIHGVRQPLQPAEDTQLYAGPRGSAADFLALADTLMA